MTHRYINIFWLGCLALVFTPGVFGSLREDSDFSSSSSLAAATPMPTKAMPEDALDFVSLNYLLVAITLAAILLVAYTVHKIHSDFLSESGAIIILGIAVGGIFYLIDYASNDNGKLLGSITFDRALFINLLLPVIIFEAGFSIKHSGVMRNLGAVLLFAIIGTMISTILIGLGVFYMSSFVAPDLYNHPGGAFISLALGALLSATDPVSVIALLGSQYDLSKEPPLLYNLVFGESVLNDAVAIVIYEVCQKYINSPEVSARSLGIAFGQFVMIFVVSTLIGYIVGLLCSKLFKHLSMDELPHLEVAMCIIFGGISYYLCDFLDMSGIMGLFMTARIIGHHAIHNMSFMARNTIAFVLKTLASLAESAVFLLLGTSVWAFHSGWNAKLVVVVIACCLISRVFVVFPLAALSNYWRTIEVITAKMQIFMWYSGLRGAIAFGLVILLHSQEGVGSQVGSEMLTSTLGVILFTVLFMGAFAAKLLKFLGLGRASMEEEEIRITTQRQSMRMSMQPGSGGGGGKQRSISALLKLEAMEDLEEERGFGKFIIHLEKTFIERFVRRSQELPPPDIDNEDADFRPGIFGGGYGSTQDLTNVGEGMDGKLEEGQGSEQPRSSSRGSKARKAPSSQQYLLATDQYLPQAQDSEYPGGGRNSTMRGLSSHRSGRQGSRARSSYIAFEHGVTYASKAVL